MYNPHYARRKTSFEREYLNPSCCIYSGALGRSIAELRAITPDTAPLYQARLYNLLQTVWRVLPCDGRGGNWEMIHAVMNYEGAPFETWRAALVERLTDYLCRLNFFARMFDGEDVNSPVSDVIPLTWREWLKSDHELVASESHIQFYRHVNRNYIVIGARVLRNYGYHGQNLYNAFASVPYREGVIAM